MRGLLISELRINGQRQGFLCCALALWKRSSPIPQIGKTLLKMQRHRVVDLSAYTLFLKRGSQLVSPYGTNHILVEDVALGHDFGEQQVRRSVLLRAECRAVRDFQARLYEEASVPLGVPLAGGCPVIQMSQFG